MDASCEERSSWVRFTETLAWLCSDEIQPYVQLVLFFAMVLALYLTMYSCELCVFGVMMFSMVFCCQYRLMLITLCASVGVLWVYGWRFGGGRGFSASWN